MPIAIRYGVPERTFWDMNPRRLEPWQRMYEYEQQEEADRRDYDAWLHGRYVLEAIANALDGKRNPYPSEPYTIQQRREEQDEANKIAADKFRAFAMVFNEQFRKKQEQSS